MASFQHLSFYYVWYQKSRGCTLSDPVITDVSCARIVRSMHVAERQHGSRDYPPVLGSDTWLLKLQMQFHIVSYVVHHYHPMRRAQHRLHH